MKKRFGKVIGNAVNIELLATELENGTQSHAYIIEGPVGSGKHTIAKEICKALFCLREGEDFPCGKCRFCKLTEAGYNTDISFWSKGEKATIQVDVIRELTSTISYAPDVGKYKVYIIEDAEKMNVSAQNALLLSLEEPPSYVVFLLLCTDSASLLETVRSRAVTLKTELFSTDFVESWLKSSPQVEKSGADSTSVRNAAIASGGSLGAALAALDVKADGSAALVKEAEVMVEKLCRAPLAQRLLYFSSLKYSRGEYEQLFTFALKALRDLIAVKTGFDETLFYTDRESAAAVCSRVKMKKLVELYDAVSAADADIKANASSNTVLTSLACSKA